MTRKSLKLVALIAVIGVGCDNEVRLDLSMLDTGGVVSHPRLVNSGPLQQWANQLESPSLVWRQGDPAVREDVLIIDEVTDVVILPGDTLVLLDRRARAVERLDLRDGAPLGSQDVIVGSSGALFVDGGQLVHLGPQGESLLPGASYLLAGRGDGSRVAGACLTDELLVLHLKDGEDPGVVRVLDRAVLREASEPSTREWRLPIPSEVDILATYHLITRSRVECADGDRVLVGNELHPSIRSMSASDLDGGTIHRLPSVFGPDLWVSDRGSVRRSLSELSPVTMLLAGITPVDEGIVALQYRESPSASTTGELIRTFLLDLESSEVVDAGRSAYRLEMVLPRRGLVVRSTSSPYASLEVLAITPPRWP